jgi:hypothetical protein
MRTLSHEKHPIQRVIGSIILILVLASSLFLAWGLWRDHSLAKGFDKIADGSTQENVVRLMGKPKKVEKCGEFFGPIPQSEVSACANEYFYTATFAPWTPQYFIVRFDGGGRVISKVPLSSP